MIRIRDPKNFACAGLFILLALALGASAVSLPIGTASSMGPGYFPLALAIILGVLGLLLAVNSVRVEGPKVAPFAWRGFILVILAIAAFGATIGRLGFVPAVALTIGICIPASRFRPLHACALMVFLVVFCCAVFVWGLGLPVRLFGS